MRDQTWVPSAQGKEGKGADLMFSLCEAEGVMKQVDVLISDHVAGSWCSFKGEVEGWGVYGILGGLEVSQDSGKLSGEDTAWILRGGKIFSESSEILDAFLLRLWLVLPFCTGTLVCFPWMLKRIIFPLYWNLNREIESFIQLSLCQK